jgi:hypothetical protein
MFDPTNTESRHPRYIIEVAEEENISRASTNELYLVRRCNQSQRNEAPNRPCIDPIFSFSLSGQLEVSGHGHDGQSLCRVSTPARTPRHTVDRGVERDHEWTWIRTSCASSLQLQRT